jgi:ankyrin repeat protein
MSWFPNAHVDITKTCVTYLAFEVFDSGRVGSEFETFDYDTRLSLENGEYKTRLQLNPLFDYAAWNWGFYARKTLMEYDQLVLDLLKSEAKVAACGQALELSEAYSSCYLDRNSGRITGVQLAAYFGLGGAIMALIQNGVELDCIDPCGRTPLSRAAELGHEAVVKLLLAADEVDPDSKKNASDRTPLSYAARMGHEAVVELLLGAGVNPDSKAGTDDRTPLSHAAQMGHEAVVKLLLAQDGVDPDSHGWLDGITPLLYAASNGCDAVVKLLLADDRINLNAYNTYEEDVSFMKSALGFAAQKGHVAVVELLLAEDGVDQYFEDDEDQTALSIAAKYGHEEVVELLLTKRIPLDSWFAQNSLRSAVREGHDGVAKLLLKAMKVQLKTEEVDGEILLMAAENRHEAVVKLLLAEERIDLNYERKWYPGETALSLAARQGHVTVVRLLLAKDGVDPHRKDCYNKTALSWAEERKHAEVVKLLTSIS